MSDYFYCNYRADGPTIITIRDSTKLNGFFKCHGFYCNKIRQPFQCDRYCPNIATQAVNVIIMHVSFTIFENDKINQLLLIIIITV